MEQAATEHASNKRMKAIARRVKEEQTRRRASKGTCSRGLHEHTPESHNDALPLTRIPTEERQGARSSTHTGT